MKIIEHGIYHKYAKIECKNCGCIFRIEKTDKKNIYENIGRFLDNTTPITKYIICPECEYSVLIEEYTC